jgi:hypothetical protein
MRDEIYGTLLCACRERGGECMEPFPYDIEDETFSALIEAGYSHGVVPHLYRWSLSSGTMEKVSEGDNFSILKSHYTNNLKRNLQLFSETIRISELFSRAEIPHIVFKGAILSYTLWGDISMRQFGDIDILIEKERIDEAVALLEKEGYRQREDEVPPYLRERWREVHKEVELLHMDKKIDIDLHYDLLDGDCPLSSPVDMIWRERRTIDVGTGRLDTISPEWNAVYLSIHGSRHIWQRIGWISDLDTLLRRKDLDWDRIAEIYDLHGFGEMVLFGFAVCRRYLATPFGEEFSSLLESRESLHERLFEDVERCWRGECDSIRRLGVILKLLPDRSSRFAYIFKVLFRPTRVEFRMVGLPKILYPLYYPIRILSLPLRKMRSIGRSIAPKKV